MFQEFYNLSGSPFLLTPDSRFFFASSGHSRAMAQLVYGLSRSTALRQAQVLKRILDLLESNETRQS